MKNGEYLSDDILEESFVKIFKPFLNIQKLTGSCRVDARDRFISSPTFYQKLFTISCASVVLTLEYRLITVAYDKYYEKYPLQFFILSFMILVQIIIYACNLIHLRFLNAADNTKFYIKLQHIDRSLKLDRDLELSTLQHNSHVSAIVLIYAIATCLLASGLTGGMAVVLTNFSLIYCESPFIFEMSHCNNLLMHFTCRIGVVNGIMWNHLLGKPKNKTKPNRVFYATKAFFRSIAAKQHCFKSSDTYIYLRDIFTCFKSYQDLYKYQILLLCIKFFIYVMSSYEFTLLLLKNNEIRTVELVLVISIVFIDFITLLLLCLRCSFLFSTIKTTKLLTITIMSIHLEGPLREKARKMYNLIEDTPPRLSVYDMWDMETRVMLVFFNVVTSFFVTFLQFTFL